jgi:hypothetical protein
MNIDTDTQYAFTRPVVEHMFKNYDGVSRLMAKSAIRRLTTHVHGVRLPKPVSLLGLGLRAKTSALTGNSLLK